MHYQGVPSRSQSPSVATSEQLRGTAQRAVSLEQTDGAEESCQRLLKTIAPPESYLCPITHKLFRDPVITVSGVSYEKEAIEEWIKTSGSDPFSREPITGLIPNRALQSSVEEFLEDHPEFRKDQYINQSRSLGVRERAANVPLLDVTVRVREHAANVTLPDDTERGRGLAANVRLLEDAERGRRRRDARRELRQVCSQLRYAAGVVQGCALVVAVLLLVVCAVSPASRPSHT